MKKNALKSSLAQAEENRNEAATDKLPPFWGKFKMPSSWTQNIILAAMIAGIIIILAVTLPIELHPRDPPDDPSYHAEANRPKRVLDNFPDPGLLRINGTWFAYGTNAETNDTEVPNVPVATSHDFKNWTRLADPEILPFSGEWEDDDNHWAPDVIRRDDGKFVLYYSGELQDWKRHHCVGVAVSNTTSPLGPYLPQNAPLVCPLDQGGAIDPAPFRDADGKLYITYKADVNSVGNGGICNNSKKPLLTVRIMLQEFKKDGVTPIGDPVAILENDPDKDGPLVESPSLIRTARGVYYLFFSSHCFTSPDYNIKYASSNSLRGPYKKAKRPLLQTGDFDLTTPGSATVSQDGTKMVFHGNCDHKRCMYVAGIHINSTVTLSPL